MQKLFIFPGKRKKTYKECWLRLSLPEMWDWPQFAFAYLPTLILPNCFNLRVGWGSGEALREGQGNRKMGITENFEAPNITIRGSQMQAGLETVRIVVLTWYWLASGLDGLFGLLESLSQSQKSLEVFQAISVPFSSLLSYIYLWDLAWLIQEHLGNNIRERWFFFVEKLSVHSILWLRQYDEEDILQDYSRLFD